MTCTAEELQSAMAEFTGGSSERYVIRQCPDFQFSGGVHRVVELTKGLWLLRLCAETLAPAYAQAWAAGRASIGQISVDVTKAVDGRYLAVVRLILADDVPAEIIETVPGVAFPEGSWNFYFGTDPGAPGRYITTMIIPEEY